MAYNQMLQSTIDKIKEIARTDLCVMDTEGEVAAATEEGFEVYRESVFAFMESSAEIQVVREFQYFKIYDGGQLEYVLMVRGENDGSYTIGRLAAFQIQTMLAAYKERYDRENFIKNILLDNMLLVDVHNKAKKLHVALEVPRAVFVIEIGQDGDGHQVEAIKSLFAGRTQDFVTAVDEDSVILVKELDEDEDYESLNQTAGILLDALGGEQEEDIYVAYGTIVHKIRDISTSYKEARIALDVGKIFYADRHIIAYNRLGIGRLIYQLPVSLGKIFIDEIFPETKPGDFDEETLLTIRKFFENNLNVSETARQLYIHRNTLVYRLDKVHKATGLDLRVFEDAITFQISLMVLEYIDYVEKHNY